MTIHHAILAAFLQELQPTNVSNVAWLRVLHAELARIPASSGKRDSIGT